MSMVHVLVIDNIASSRWFIRETLQDDPSIRLETEAASAKLGLELAQKKGPEVIILNIRISDISSEQVIRSLLELASPPAILLVGSDEDDCGARIQRGLANGAADYLVRPVEGEADYDSRRNEFRTMLLQKIHLLAKKECGVGMKAKGWEAVLVGSSTGGPDALRDFLTGLPADFPLPIIIVQHMLKGFAATLAESLQKACRLKVREASHGEMVLAGTVYIAPSGEHLLVQQNESNQIMLYTSDAPPVNSCKPAVDVLFASAAENLGRQLLVVVLTGMGEDGLNGVRALRKRGKGYFLIQDEKSSLVWGMPGAIVKSGLADEVLSPAEIAGRLKKLTGVC